MKALIHFLTLALLGLSERVLGCRAEYGDQVTIPGFTAAASLSHHQYGVVRMATATTVNIASEVNVSSATAAPFGFLQNKPYVDEAAQVCVFGLTKMFAGGTVTAGAYVTYDSSGHVVDASSGDMVIGRALQAATTAGEKVLGLALPPVRWAF